MKTLEELRETANLLIGETGIDGGSGYIHYGTLKNCSVIWSFGGGWEHVSVCPTNRTPTWDDMCKIKDMFWHKDETVIQYHPSEENYVNVAKNCLHLWKPIGIEIPIPPTKFV